VVKEAAGAVAGDNSGRKNGEAKRCALRQRITCSYDDVFYVHGLKFDAAFLVTA
jgi:hypothetical protein